MDGNVKLKVQFVQRNEFVRGNGTFKGLQISSIVLEQKLNEVRKKIDLSQIMKGSICLTSVLVALLLWECFSNCSMCYVTTWRTYITEDSWTVSSTSDPVILLMMMACSTLRNTSLDDGTALKKCNVGNVNRFSYC